MNKFFQKNKQQINNLLEDQDDEDRKSVFLKLNCYSAK